MLRMTWSLEFPACSGLLIVWTLRDWALRTPAVLAAPPRALPVTTAVSMLQAEGRRSRRTFKALCMLSSRSGTLINRCWHSPETTLPKPPTSMTCFHSLNLLVEMAGILTVTASMSSAPSAALVSCLTPQTSTSRRRWVCIIQWNNLETQCWSCSSKLIACQESLLR